MTKLRFTLHMALLAVLWTLVILMLRYHHKSVDLPAKPAHRVGKLGRHTLPHIPDNHQTRPVYGHAIVPGGIHDDVDLLRAYNAGALPKDFDIKQAHFTRLLRERCDFTTFIGRDGKVKWSKRKICVPAGTLVIVSGRYTILARCGNMLAPELPPDVPVESLPTDAVIPQPEPTTAPGFVSSLYPSPTPLPPDVPPTSVPPPGQPPTYCSYPPQRVTVPDGDHGILFVVAGILGAIIAVSRRNR